LYIGGFMRSVAWAAGAIVLVHILRNPERYLPRLFPWALSFIATMITLTTWGRGVLFTNSRANVWDSVYPTLMGIVEFCLFAILAPPEVFGGKSRDKPKDNDPWWQKLYANTHAWHFWFFGLAVHAGLAVKLVNNRMENTNTEIDYVPKLHSLACQYMEWMRADKIGAATGVKVSIGFGILLVVVIRLFKWIYNKESKSAWNYVVLGLLGLVYVGIFVVPASQFIPVIKEAERQRQVADEQVSQIQDKIVREEAQNAGKNVPANLVEEPPGPCPNPTP
jgi:hypothetical protein